MLGGVNILGGVNMLFKHVNTPPTIVIPFQFQIPRNNPDCDPRNETSTCALRNVVRAIERASTLNSSNPKT